IDAMNGGNQLLFEGSLSVSGESISQPPAVLNVGGSGSAFHVGSWSVVEPASNGGRFQANLASVESFEIGGRNRNADFLNVGDTALNLPSTLNLRAPGNNQFDSTWAANDPLRQLDRVNIRPPFQFFVPEGAIKLRNPPSELNAPA